MASPEITYQFGAAVRKLRHGLDISQATLAERAGLHQTYVAGIESGKRNVTLKCVEKLANALRVPTSELFATPEPLEKAPPSAAYVDILMVEDNRDDVEMTLRAFQKARFSNTVQVVHDGKEALDFLFCTGAFSSRKIEDRPQLILLDLHLPKVNGVEVLRRIKADPRTRTIPVAVLTASADAAERTECKRLGADTFLVKPVDLMGLGSVTPHLNFNWALLKLSSATGRNIRRRTQNEL